MTSNLKPGMGLHRATALTVSVAALLILAGCTVGGAATTDAQPRETPAPTQTHTVPISPTTPTATIPPATRTPIPTRTAAPKPDAAGADRDRRDGGGSSIRPWSPFGIGAGGTDRSTRTDADGGSIIQPFVRPVLPQPIAPNPQAPEQPVPGGNSGLIGWDGDFQGGGDNPAPGPGTGTEPEPGPGTPSGPGTGPQPGTPTPEPSPVVRPAGLAPADLTPDIVRAMWQRMNQIRAENGLQPVPTSQMRVGLDEWSQLVQRHAEDATGQLGLHDGAIVEGQVQAGGTLPTSELTGARLAEEWWNHPEQRALLYKPETMDWFATHPSAAIIVNAAAVAGRWDARVAVVDTSTASALPASVEITAVDTRTTTDTLPEVPEDAQYDPARTYPTGTGSERPDQPTATVAGATRDQRKFSAPAP